MRGRSNNFDALRLAGAMTVLVGHQWAVMGHSVPVVIGFKHIATVAVYMFFSISGYLVAASWAADPNLFRFSARRFLRMAPGFAVLSAVSWLAILGLGSDYFPNNPLPAFNGSLWTLKWEVLCYAALALLALVMPMRIAALLALAALMLYWRSAVFKHIPELGLMFAAGMLLYAYPIRRKWLAIGIACLAAYAMKREPFFVLLMLVPILSITVGNASWPVIRRAGRFGDFSYGVYIYAFPVQQFGVLWFGKDQPVWLLMTFSLALTFSLAALSWHYVEKPALGLKDRLGRKPGSLGVLQHAGVTQGSGEPG